MPIELSKVESWNLKRSALKPGKELDIRNVYLHLHLDLNITDDQDPPEAPRSMGMSYVWWHPTISMPFVFNSLNTCG